MKIGIISPLYEACPPKFYGGTERVVTHLCNNLVDLGCDVTLFASGDSNTKATLYPITEQSLRLAEPIVRDPHAYIAKQVDVVVNQSEDFDIIHNHIDYHPFTAATYHNAETPWVTTLHGRLDLPEFKAIYEHFISQPMVSISRSQRRPLPNNHWIANIYHGLDIDSFTPRYSQGKYLAFLGRICRDKGIDRAIEISKKLDIPLKIAAKIDDNDIDFYKKKIVPQIDGHHIEYVGEIAEEEKSEFLGNAYALIFAINWPEPFGLAVIEAMACGTPVVARPFGSMPEIIDEGKTGYLRNSTEDLAKAVLQVERLDRKAIRRVAEKRFSAMRMAKDYLKVYQQLTQSRRRVPESLKLAAS